MDEIGIFSVEQVCKLARITERQVRHWATSDFYKPEFLRDDGGPFSQIYSFRDVVALRTIGVLRNKHGITMPALRKAGTWLSERHDTPWASLRFRISGKGLYYIDPIARSPVAITGPLGQQAHPGLIKLDAIALQVRRAVVGMKQRKARDVGKLTQARNIAANACVVAGTRIPTATIWRFHQAGYTVDQIISEFSRLKRRDVEQAITYEHKQQRLAS